MTESRLLWISIIATTGFSVMGIIWGLIADSGIILFDGLYSLVSLGLSVLSLLTLMQISRGDSEKYPFGRAQFEPMLVAFKSAMIIGMCSYAAFDSFAILLRGGRDVAMESALAYSVISATGCLAVTILLMRYTRKIPSALLMAEKYQWIGDTLLSSCVLIAFTFAKFVLAPHYPDYVRYVDPLMVIVAALVFILLPGKSLVSAMREMLFIRADDEIFKPLKRVAKLVDKELGLHHSLRVIVIGRQLEVEVNFLAEGRKFTVAEMDAVRQRFRDIADELGEQAWINVSFTEEEMYL